VVFVLYGILASGVSTYLTNSPRAIKRIQRSFAVIFAALAAQLALSEQ
jgi:threonine/homoserine/homoserine lactone efflux protein